MSSTNENTPLTGNENVDSFLIRLVAIDTAEQIAENWKAILIIGIINVVVGFFCLWFPFFATAVAEMAIAWSVLFAGLLGVTMGFRMPEGHRSDYFIMGIFQILLAFLMFMHPLFTLTILTLVIAVLFMMLGSSRLALANQNPDMPHRFLVQSSGVLSIAMSFFICLTMPLARWYTIGVLLGVNLINIGSARIGLALHGRQLAASDSDNYSSLPR